MTESTSSENRRQWQPLDRLQRRVLGVLVEKAKTTPDAYPMTVNAIRTACNQKTNRHPQMDLDSDDVQATLDELRQLGVVVEVQGEGRAIKYRHKAYEWLGVDKLELAVMTELLLRGTQTTGELRGRAARMEPIGSLADLKPVLSRLIDRRLVVALTPEGRGQIVTHGLYPDDEQPEPGQPAGMAAGHPHPPTRHVPGDAVEFESRMTQIQESIDDLARRVATLEQKSGN